MKNLALVMMMVSLFGLTACESLDGRGNKELIGAGSGAVIGGVLGSNVGNGKGQLIATGAGALVGAWLGSEVGRSLDRADRQYMEGAAYEAQRAPVGDPISWSNPESGNSGQITPTRDGYSASGRYCREFQQTVFIGGREETAFGTACKQADGTWQIVNEG